jgi:hypothetical protein
LAEGRRREAYFSLAMDSKKWYFISAFSLIPGLARFNNRQDII